MRLLYLLSADAGNLHAVCCSLAEAMLNLTDSLLRSRIHQQEQQREMPSVLAHRVRRYLDAHHCEAITLRMVAERLHVSEYYLAHVFKQEGGVPPMQYVMKRRIGEAQGFLMNTSIPIAEIADTLGFSSICHFNAMFKKYTGTPPGKFRQSFKQSITHSEKGKSEEKES